MASKNANNRVLPAGKPVWCQQAQSALEQVASFKKDFRAKALAVQSANNILQAINAEDADAIDAEEDKAKKQKVKQYAELSAVGKRLKAAKRGVNAHLEIEAKRHCRRLCEKFYQILPRELRNIIYSELLTENNATFYGGPSVTVKLVNGLNDVQHSLDSTFTSPGVHKEVIEELSRNGARFDFRHRHDLIGKAFKYYASLSIDLAPILRKVGLTFNMKDLTKREIVFDHLKQLYKLDKGTTIFIFIETSGKTLSQTSHSFSMVLRMVFPTMQELRDAGYRVKAVLNPSYVRSAVKNDDGCGFSLIHEQRFRYAFSDKNAQFSVAGFESKLKAYLEEYGDSWGHRIDLVVDEEE